jgi:cofilin
LTLAIHSVAITDECVSAFNEFRLSQGKIKYIIYKISDDKKSVVIDHVGKDQEDQDYEVFRERLAGSQDSEGNPVPRYAVYDVEYTLSATEGKRYASTSPNLTDRLLT